MATSADELARRAAALEQRARAARPTTWRPDDAAHEHPAVIVGELVDWDRRASGYDPDRDVDIATLRTPAGAEWAIFGHGAVLEQEFAKLRARKRESIGALVAVRFEGLVEKPGARPYKSFRVVVDRAGDVDPAATSTQPDAPAPPAGPEVCSACSFEAPNHAVGCPEDVLPF